MKGDIYYLKRVSHLNYFDSVLTMIYIKFDTRLKKVTTVNTVWENY